MNGSDGDRAPAVLVVSHDRTLAARIEAAALERAPEVETRHAAVPAEVDRLLDEAPVVLVVVDGREPAAAAVQAAAELRDVDLLLLVPGGTPPPPRELLERVTAHEVLLPDQPHLLGLAVQRHVRQALSRQRRHAPARLREAVETVRHDVAVPLAAIEGFAQTLRSRGDDLGEEQRGRALDRIATNTARVRRLVGDLERLALGELEEELPGLAVELQPVLRHVVDDLGPPGDEVRVSCPERLRVDADDVAVARIVTNLVDNALKYGEGPVDVEARERGERVEVRVHDRGPGVPAGFVPSLFDRYTRADDQQDRPGTGIGLAVARELAQAMDGDLRYEPEGAGATFVLELPAAPPASTAAVPEEPAARGEQAVRQEAATRPETGPARDGGTAAGGEEPFEVGEVLDQLVVEAGDHGGRAVPAGGTTTVERPVVGRLELVHEGLTTRARAVLDWHGHQVTGEATGVDAVPAGLRAVARATLDAVEHHLAGVARFEVDNLRVDEDGGDTVVRLTLTALTRSGSERLAGVAIVRGDLEHAAMNATLHALNRRLPQLAGAG